MDEWQQQVEASLAYHQKTLDAILHFLGEMEVVSVPTTILPAHFDLTPKEKK